MAGTACLDLYRGPTVKLVSFLLKASADKLHGTFGSRKKAGDLTLAEKITELVGKIGEKLEVRAVVPYIHAGSKLGVLVSLKGVNGNDVTGPGKDVGMQIAAMNLQLWMTKRWTNQ